MATNAAHKYIELERSLLIGRAAHILSEEEDEALLDEMTMYWYGMSPDEQRLARQRAADWALNDSIESYFITSDDMGAFATSITLSNAVNSIYKNFSDSDVEPEPFISDFTNMTAKTNYLFIWNKKNANTPSISTQSSGRELCLI